MHTNKINTARVLLDTQLQLSRLARRPKTLGKSPGRELLVRFVSVETSEPPLVLPEALDGRAVADINFFFIF